MRTRIPLRIVSGTICALIALTIAFTIGSTTARAATITLGLYHLGEADSPTPVIGGSGDTTTEDSTGGTDLTRTGTTAYSADVGAANTAGASPTANSISMDFTGGVYRRATSISTATADLGFEAWAKPDTDTANGFIFMNGNGFTGFGQYLYLDTTGKWTFAKAGIGTIQSSATLGQWVHLACVLDDGGGLHAYVNGTSVGTFGGGSNAAVISDGFSIGGTIEDSPFPRAAFDGLIDEVRVFTFANFAAFDPLTDLNLTAVPAPEPSGIMLLCLGAPLLSRRRRSV